LCRRFYGGSGGADQAGVISVSAILCSLVQYLGGRERGGLYNYCTSILNHFYVGAIILAHGYFVLHAVCSACRFTVNGNFNLFFWVNGNFILIFLGEPEFWKKINSMWFLSLQK
jgi:hypothetical protein